jgi:hypothetical protein
MRQQHRLGTGHPLQLGVTALREDAVAGKMAAVERFLDVAELAADD